MRFKQSQFYCKASEADALGLAPRGASHLLEEKTPKENKRKKRKIERKKERQNKDKKKTDRQTDTSYKD